MSDWKRSTREISFDQLPSDVRAATQKHIARYDLGSILSETLMSVQTDSEKVKKGLFGSVEVIHQGVVVTPRWLVWAVSGAKTPIAVLSAFLKDIVVQDYVTTSFAKMIPDSGIEVSGKFTDAGENASAFIGLENNVVGKRFIEVVIGAVQNAKK